MTDANSQRMVAEMAELIGGLAHELRNPLSTMMINLKLLAEDLADQETNIEDVRRRATNKVELLRREAERLQSLFDEFLSLTGPFTLDLRKVDIRSLVSDLIEFVEPMAKSCGIEIEFDVPVTPFECSLDENLVRQALLNLLINAQQAMPEGGVLTITFQQDDTQIGVTVGDTGVGITDSDLTRIHRPFFSTKKGGNGLGLSITNRVIAEHGGRLEIKSELGKGTQATILLPR